MYPKSLMVVRHNYGTCNCSNIYSYLSHTDVVATGANGEVGPSDVKFVVSKVVAKVVAMLEAFQLQPAVLNPGL